MTRKERTAERFVERLRSDPEYQAGIARNEARRKERVRLQREDERPLVGALRSAGFDVGSTWDLVERKEPYPEAVPILLRHLRTGGHGSDVRTMIARALTVPEIAQHIPEMVQAFHDDEDGRLNGPKWAIGNAIDVFFDDSLVEEIIELALDPHHGSARSILVWALGQSQSTNARRAIEKIREDPDEQVAIMVDKSLARWDRTNS